VCVVYFAPTRAGGPGTITPIRGWRVRSSAVEHESGATISRPDFRASGWVDAPARSTVLGALLASGRFPDVHFSTNMRDQIDPTMFAVPWWYRTSFTVDGPAATLLRLDGVIHRAELWVNGAAVAGTADIAGAYPVHTFDISDLVVTGPNAIALCVYPGNAMEDLSIGWVDWNPAPPDNNMGVWRDVAVVRSGEVRLADLHVRAESATSQAAELRVSVDAHNTSGRQQSVTLAAAIVGPGEPIRFTVTETLQAGESRRLDYSPGQVAALRIEHPQLWWPVRHGDQPIHQLRVTATIDGELSDVANTTFGIRTISSYLAPGGGRQFVVNGREIQILGGGWCSDLFLRSDYQRLVDEITLAADLGLNTIRLEGKLENPEFFDIADRLGVLVLPGWECCNKWEAHAGTGAAAWSDHDYVVARRSMAAEARLLRNHPCVLCFQIGSDFAPPPELAAIYVDELRRAEWALPIVSSGSSEFNNDWAGGASELGTTATEAAGLSGMKMWPYDWVPPVYWYGTQYGGAVGFSSESSAGHTIPRLPKMLSPAELDQLWQRPSGHQYHAAPPSPFDNVGIFATALGRRYGEIASLRDFVRKAQLANYEMVRAQFEAYGARARAPERATGLIYWMLNTAWPSVNWQLYDFYLDQAGAYFGAKKANEPVHAQYAYDTGEVLVVNHGHLPTSPLRLEEVVRALDGSVISTITRAVAPVEAGAARSVGTVVVPASVAGGYFLELALALGTGDLAPVGRNVYWLSTVVDVLDWEATFWQHTPTAEFADLTGLATLPAVAVAATAYTTRAAGQATTVVTLHNPGTVPAVALHASIVVDPSSTAVAPVYWDDNEITLFGGQQVTLTARYSVAGLGPFEPRVEIDGFNVHAPFTVTSGA
jgi:exo-1,4-beta-D-glucosaminidase